MPIDCNRCGGSVAVDEDDREAGYVQCENCRTVLDLTTGRGSAGGSESSRSDAVVDWQAGSTGAASTGREVGADSSTSQRSDRSVEGWERADGGSTGTAADAGGASVESTPSGDPFPEADPLEDLSQLDVELPGGVTLVDDADGLHLVRHWNRLYSVAGALVTAFGLFWTSTGDIIQPSADLMDLAMLAAGLLTVAGAGYWTLCQLLNDTHVRIGPSNSGLELTVEHGPLYWPGRHRISADRVQQLYVSEHVHRTRRGREKFYSLQLQERGKRDVALLNYLKSPEDALAIERAVESYLQIEDKTVAGEMQGESKGLLGRLFG